MRGPNPQRPRPLSGTEAGRKPEIIAILGMGGDPARAALLGRHSLPCRLRKMGVPKNYAWLPRSADSPASLSKAFRVSARDDSPNELAMRASSSFLVGLRRPNPLTISSM